MTVKPLVKHIISKELQLYFDRIVSAIIDETNDEYRLAAFASLRTDPGLHQLVPYFVQFAAEKVTHGLKNLFVLSQTMHLLASLLDNPSLYLETYVASMVPSVLTCLVGKRLGASNDKESLIRQYELRDLASSLTVTLAKKYGKSSQTLKPRLARTLLKHFLDPNKPFGTHYGALMALQGIVGADGVRMLILPNLKPYDSLLKEGIADDSRKQEAEMVIVAIMRALDLVEKDAIVIGDKIGSDAREKLASKVGEIIASKVMESGRRRLVSAILEADVSL